MSYLVKTLDDVSVEVNCKAEKRIVEAYVSIFGNRDRAGDIVHRGAFQKSIGPGSRLSRGLVPVKHNHQTIVGKLLNAMEDSKGLLTEQKYATDPQSDRIFGLVRDGMLPTQSFKYMIPTGGAYTKTENGQRTQHLTELVLLEAGPADPDIAVNEETFVTAVKAAAVAPEQALVELYKSLASVEVTEEMIDQLTAEECKALRGLLGQLPEEFSAVDELSDLIRGRAGRILIT